MKITARLTVLALALFLLWAPLLGPSNAAAESLVLVDGNGMFNLYKEHELSSLLTASDTVGQGGATSLMPDMVAYSPTIRTDDLNTIMDQDDVSMWFFVSDQALSQLGDSQLASIEAQAKQGAVVGIGGDDDALKDSLNLQGSNNDIEPNEDGYYVFLCNATADGLREDYQLTVRSGLELGAAWQNMLSWTIQQLSGTISTQGSSLAGYVPQDAPLGDTYVLSSDSNGDYTLSSDSYDPWLATYSAKISDIGDNADIAETISVYKLDTTSETHDWYRVDLNTQGSCWNYYDWWMSVGNYIYSVESKLYSWNDGGELWEHAPETTQTNTTVSYSLGASLKEQAGSSSYVGAQIDTSYSKSYDCSEVTINDYSSHAQDEGSWSAEPRGPDWDSWLWFDYAPSDTAQTSYTYEPSTIWKVEKDNSVELITQCATVLEWSSFYLILSYSEHWWDAETFTTISAGGS